ncbi:IgM heavy chain, constant region domains one, two, three and four [Aix galericulata]|nr:IgM heavy chain, constant region domains one, two, three and four [Aix galericulata]
MTQYLPVRFNTTQYDLPVRPNTSQYNLIPPSMTQFLPVRFNTTQYDLPVQPNTSQYNPIPPSTPQNLLILPNTTQYDLPYGSIPPSMTSQYNPISPSMTQYLPVQPNTTQYDLPVRPNTSQYGPIPPSMTSQYNPIPPSTPQYLLIRPNTTQYPPVPPTNPRSPTLFPLVSCASSSSSSSLYAVGCVAVGHVPAGVTFSWTDATNQSMAAAVLTFPEARGAGGNMATSRLELPLQEGKGRQPFYCRAAHPRGNAVVANGAPVTAGAVTTGARTDGTGAYVTDSWLGVSEAEWDAGTVYTCQAEGEMRNSSKSLECGLDKPENSDIAVRVLPPSFVDIFNEKVAKLTCKVSNLPTVEGLVISWLKEDGQKLETKTMPRVLQANSLYGVEGVASVCADEWNKEEVYTCKVSHPELLFPVEEKLQKATERDAKPPTLYVFPPPPEQLSAHETATVTCLAKGFNPPDLFIRWLRNGEPLPASSYVTMPPVAESQLARSYFTYSALTVATEDWGAGNVFTCLVGHERLPLQVAQKSVDKSSGKPTSVNVSLVLSDTASSCY